MKSSTKIMLTISSFVLFSTLTIPAFAGGFSLGYGSHGSHYSAGYGHRSYGHRGYSGHSRSGTYGRHSYLGKNYGYRNSHNYQKHSYPNYSHNNYSSYSRAPSYKKSCHDVFKTTVDRYGQYHKTGGTMCYDSYGKAYIVSGSRYQIQ